MARTFEQLAKVRKQQLDRSERLDTDSDEQECVWRHGKLKDWSAFVVPKCAPHGR